MSTSGRLQTFVNPTTMTKDIVYPLVLRAQGFQNLMQRRKGAKKNRTRERTK